MTRSVFPILVAVTGIDGSGKSGIARYLMENPQKGGLNIEVMACPAFHDRPGIPQEDLSRSLEALNELADEQGSFELKGMALYLQMCLFGPVLDHIRNTTDADVILTERHALIDTLVYGDFYKTMIKRPLSQNKFEPLIRRQLKVFSHDAYAQLMDWFEAENERIGDRGTFWKLPLYLRDLSSSQTEAFAGEVMRHFQSRFPDLAIFVDLPAADAMARLKARAGTGELHEKEETLDHLRNAYLRIMDWLDQHGQGTQIIILDATALENEAATADAVLQQIKTHKTASRQHWT